MYQNIWDGYNPSDVSEKIRYWVDIWEYLIENLAKAENENLFTNPHLLIKEIIDEVLFNNFQNKDNREYFKRQIEFFLEKDKVSADLYKTDLRILHNAFQPPRTKHILCLCRNLDDAYSKGKYTKDIFDAIQSNINRPKWEKGDEEAIKFLCQLLIGELMIMGYHLDTIKRFPEYAFRKKDPHWILTKEMACISEKDFEKDGVINYIDYRKAIAQEAEKINIYKRFDALKKLLHPVETECFFIFPVDGLKVTDLDASIANVHFYDPKKKPYITNSPQGSFNTKDEELFPHKEVKTFANAAVRIKGFDYRASEFAAIEQIEKALDFYRLYLKSEVPISVIGTNHIRVSLDGKFLGGTATHAISDITHYRYKYHSLLDISSVANLGFEKEFIDAAGKQLLNDKFRGSEGFRLSHCLHWFRKAEESANYEDRLLGYWIVLENLVNANRNSGNIFHPDNERETAIGLIQESVTAIESVIFFSRSPLELFKFLRRLMNSKRNGTPRLLIDSSILEQCGINGTNTQLENARLFLDSLQLLAQGIDNRAVRNECNTIYQLYHDAKFAKSFLKNRRQRQKDELLTIYRLRNRIVHNAHYDNSVVPFWIEKAKHYAGVSMRAVLFDLFKANEVETAGVLVRYHLELERIITSLDAGIVVDFQDVTTHA
jgi:hypothetical protein